MKKYVLDTNSLIYALNDKVKIPLNDYLISIIAEIELSKTYHSARVENIK